jgi:hypothetical protein
VICCFNAEFEALLILGYHGKKGDLCLVKSDSVHHQQERLAEKKAVLLSGPSLHPVLKESDKTFKTPQH